MEHKPEPSEEQKKIMNEELPRNPWDIAETDEALDSLTAHDNNMRGEEEEESV